LRVYDWLKREPCFVVMGTSHSVVLMEPRLLCSATETMSMDDQHSSRHTQTKTLTNPKKDFKFNDGKEDHRVFVKGFPAEISKERIEEIFKDCGTIVDIRLPENRQGKRKAFFYVEFGSGLEATKANLTLHAKQIGENNQNIEVLISNPPKRGKEKTKEPTVLDISKTAYATPKNKFNLVPRMIPSTAKKTRKTANPEKAHTVQETTPEAKVESKSNVGLSNADFRAKFFQ
jgi:RNA recognition motif-containing protein